MDTVFDHMHYSIVKHSNVDLKSLIEHILYVDCIIQLYFIYIIFTLG